MKALIDSDVLVDITIDRRPFVVESGAVLAWCEERPERAVVAWHTIANFFYIVRKEIGGTSTREFISGLLEFVEVVANGTAGVKYAISLPISDFEDAMQVAVAVSAGVDYIVTRNVSDYRTSPIPAITPAGFLALVNGTAES